MSDKIKQHQITVLANLRNKTIKDVVNKTGQWGYDLTLLFTDGSFVIFTPIGAYDPEVDIRDRLLDKEEYFNTVNRGLKSIQ